MQTLLPHSVPLLIGAHTPTTFLSPGFVPVDLLSATESHRWSLSPKETNVADS